MSTEELRNSPLHGLSAETMLTELVEFYGWETLDVAIDLKCFRIKPTIPSALTFLKKAEWARNRVEDFYLYYFRQMPKGSAEEMELKPRERGFPDGVLPKDPIPLSVAKIEELRMDREARRPPEKRAPRKPPRNAYNEEWEKKEPTESTFKSRFSNSHFRKK